MPVADITKRIRYYVSNRNAGTLSVIDGFTNNIIKTYVIGSGAGEIVASEDNVIYVPSSVDSTVSIICADGSQRKLAIPNNGQIEVDSGGGRLYASYDHEVSIYDTATGAFISSIAGFTNPGYLKINKLGTELLVIDDNAVKVYRVSDLTLIATIPVGVNPNYILLNETEERAYVTNAGDLLNNSSISVIRLEDYTVIATIVLPAMSSPTGLALNGTTLYVANYGLNNVALIDTLTNTLTGVSIVTATPQRLAITPDKTKLLVTNTAAGTLTVVDLATNFVIGAILIGITDQPFDVAALYLGSDKSPGEPIDLTDTYQLDDIKESVCILAKKVFSHGQQRDCAPNVEIPIPPHCGPYTVENITFGKGYIVEGSLIITPIEDRPNFSRLRFTIRVPFEAELVPTGGGPAVIVEGFLPDINEDIIMYMPQTRDEFDFDVVVETRTELLNTPVQVGDNFVFAAGVFCIIKVVGEVQLLVPAFGYCPEPPEVEEYVDPEPPPPEDVCEKFLDFDKTPFPEDFFPFQLNEFECKL